jgi:hypothetical protein
VLDGLEPLDITQAFDPFNADPLSVKIRVYLKQMSLEGSPSVLKCRLGPLVHHAPGMTSTPLDSDSIHPIGWQQLSRGKLTEIDGRHPEQATSPLSLPDTPDHTVGPPQHGPGSHQISARHRAADPATGDMLTAEIDRVHDIDVEPLCGTKAAEGLHISAPSPAEPVIVTDHQFANRATIEQNLADEALRSQAGQMTVEPEKKHVIKRGLGQNL